MLKTENNYETTLQSAIMEPMDSLTFKRSGDEASTPDVVNDADFKSIPFLPTNVSDDYDSQSHGPGRAFLLMDTIENLYVNTPAQFCKKLQCAETDKIKVVSIFGNTGDGKSHTMNHTFFGGTEVFRTSTEQHSCTVGAHAAMQHDMGVLVLDTEGLLGATSLQDNRRTRMLLKILAISDIVIYRTRSERLHSDMFEFLGTASRAFRQHFAQALESLSLQGNAKALGPGVIIFHETRYTKPLNHSVKESPEEKLRECFERLNYETNSFSSLRYFGIQTENNKHTDFQGFLKGILQDIENTTVRSPREPGVIFRAIKALNHKFAGEIIDENFNPFPEQYFTCPVHCKSCNRRCQISMGHMDTGEKHMSSHPCSYQHSFDNKEYRCEKCYINGKQIKVTIKNQSQSDTNWLGLAKYAWMGSVIECPHHGEIYRSRQHWYGNKPPESTCVRAEIVHIWDERSVQGPANSAQMVVDSVSYLTEKVSSISTEPKKAISSWLADRVAPKYWKPNHEIINCNACKKNFEKTGLPKHHCRGCGNGFCHSCSKHEMAVPSRGWTSKSRVCNDCRIQLTKDPECTPEIATESLLTNNTNSNSNTIAGLKPPSDASDVVMRKYSEVFYNAISNVAQVAFEFPKDYIIESARPTYWVKDCDALHCFICRIPFGTAEQVELAKRNGFLTNTLIDDSTDSTLGAAALPLATDRVTTGNVWRHHCRGCGQGVCDDCSTTRCPVPKWGWPNDVRVCDSCASGDMTTKEPTKDLNTSANDNVKPD